METTENSYIYFKPGVVKSRDLTCPITACQALNMCRFQMRSCIENCAISRQ